MNEPPPPLPLPRDQSGVDADHLKLLSIFHFVGAVFALMGILFLLAHYAMMHTILGHGETWRNSRQSAPPVEIFAILQWFYLVMAVWLIGSGVLNVISGFCLRAKKHRTFSMIVAAINCLHMPLGTVLGVFTFIVLMRDSVREAYDP